MLSTLGAREIRSERVMLNVRLLFLLCPAWCGAFLLATGSWPGLLVLAATLWTVLALWRGSELGEHAVAGIAVSMAVDQLLHWAGISSFASPWHLVAVSAPGLPFALLFADLLLHARRSHQGAAKAEMVVAVAAASWLVEVLRHVEHRPIEATIVLLNIALLVARTNHAAGRTVRWWSMLTLPMIAHALFLLVYSGADSRLRIVSLLLLASGTFLSFPWTIRRTRGHASPRSPH